MVGDRDGGRSAWSDVLARDPQSDVRAQALYWSGKALAARGHESSARDMYQAAAAVRPVDYYVMRAQVALDPPPLSTRLDSSSTSGDAATSASTPSATSGS